MTILRVENLTKIYGTGETKVKALDHVSFNVEKGEFIAITGASGSGKSLYFDSDTECIRKYSTSFTAGW